MSEGSVVRRGQFLTSPTAWLSPPGMKTNLAEARKIWVAITSGIEIQKIQVEDGKCGCLVCFKKKNSWAIASVPPSKDLLRAILHSGNHKAPPPIFMSANTAIEHSGI